MLYEYLHSLSFYQLEHVGKEGRIACESIFFGDLLATCDSKIETQDSISPWMKLPKSLRILEIRWNHQLLDEYASIWMEKNAFSSIHGFIDAVVVVNVVILKRNWLYIYVYNVIDVSVPFIHPMETSYINTLEVD